MPMYRFNITLNGYGKDVDEAWLDAQEGFIDDPGNTPLEGEYTIEEDDSKDEQYRLCPSCGQLVPECECEAAK